MLSLQEIRGKHIFEFSMASIVILMTITFYSIYSSQLKSLVLSQSVFNQYQLFSILLVLIIFIHRISRIWAKIPTGSWFGVAVIILGLLGILISRYSATPKVINYSMIVTFTGLVLSIFGLKGLKNLAPVIILLFLITPPPVFIERNLLSISYIITSNLSSALLKLYGITAHIQGNIIDFGDIKLNFLLLFSPGHFILSILLLFSITLHLNPSLTIRTIVLLSAFPLLLITNIINLIIVLVLYNTHHNLLLNTYTSNIHDTISLTITLLWVLFLYFSIRHAIMRNLIVSHSEIDRHHLKSTGTEPAAKSAPLTTFAALFTLLICGYSIDSYSIPSYTPPQRRTFSSFPNAINGWTGVRAELEQKYLDSLDLSDYALWNYHNKNNTLINMFIAYYDNQKPGKSYHSPRSCLPGDGWEMRNISTIKLHNIEIGDTALSVTRMQITKGDRNQLVYYWFQQRDQVITNEFMAKWYIFWNSLIHQRSDGALFRFTTLIKTGESWSDADKRLTDFIAVAIPILYEYTPH
jgi:exosortase D (VPLPA-CTERM-specific)